MQCMCPLRLSTFIVCALVMTALAIITVPQFFQDRPAPAGNTGRIQAGGAGIIIRVTIQVAQANFS